MEPDPVQGVARGQHIPADVDPSFAEQGGDEVGKRRKIARGANAALGRDDWQRVPIDQRLESVDHRAANARETAAETEQLEQDHQSDDVARERFSEPARMRQDQVALEFGQPVARDSRVGEKPEAGVDPVDGLAARDDPLDRGGRGVDPLHARLVEARLGALPQAAQGRKVDSGGVERKHRRRSARIPALRTGAAMETGK